MLIYEHFMWTKLTQKSICDINGPFFRSEEKLVLGKTFEYEFNRKKIKSSWGGLLYV